MSVASFTPRPAWVVDLIEELSGTISGTAEQARDAIGSALVSGSGINIVVNDAGDTITISASASGGTLGGTSFPVSPASGDVFRRTDRDIEYFYDGTRWLSTQVLTLGAQAQGLTATTTFFIPIANVDYATQFWLEDATFTHYRTGAGEWDVVVSTRIANNTDTVRATVDGNGFASTTWVTAYAAIDYLFDTATDKCVALTFNEISGTSSLLGGAAITYRLVG